MHATQPVAQADGAASGLWVAAQLVLLAAVWGMGYLFFRMSVKDFGPVPVAWLRMAIAAALLLPGVALGAQGGHLLRHWRALLLIGVTNFALPFVFCAYALQTLDVGIASILNATAPLSTALIACIWLGDRLTPARMAGLVVGFSGVMLLTWQHTGPSGLPGIQDASMATGYALCIAATLLYGFAATCTKRYLSGVPPSVIAAGSLLAAALLLTPAGLAQWPASPPSLLAWVLIILQGAVCTAWAFATYFRLLTRVGPARTMATTYLTPAFAMAWGWSGLGETVTWPMLVACAVILVGTALGSGALAWRRSH